MIENSLTYQFGEGSPGNDMVPEAMIITRTNGTTIRYVPEVVLPDPVFKPGQIVRVLDKYKEGVDRYGVVTSVHGLEEVGVEFGTEFMDGRSLWSFSTSRTSIKIIHEVED